MYKVNILNLRKVKPSKPQDFRCDRGSPLGNPFPMKGEETRNEVCDLYDKYFYKHMLQSQIVLRYLNIILKVLKDAGEVNLFCWCAPKRCHAETIKKWLLEELRNG